MDDLDPRVQVPIGIPTDLPVGTRHWSGLVLSLILDEHMAYSNWKKIINIGAPPFFIV
jgi:hypothetical protein